MREWIGKGEGDQLATIRVRSLNVEQMTTKGVFESHCSSELIRRGGLDEGAKEWGEGLPQ